MKIARLECEITQPAEIMEQHFVDRFGRSSTSGESNRIWRYRISSVADITEGTGPWKRDEVVKKWEESDQVSNKLLKYFIKLFQIYWSDITLNRVEGRVTITTHVDDKLYRLGLLSLLLFPLTIGFSSIVEIGDLTRFLVFGLLGAWYAILWVLFRGPEFDVGFLNGVVVTDFSYDPHRYLLLGIIPITLVAGLLQFFPSNQLLLIVFVLLVFGVLTLAAAFINNGLPRVTVGTGRLMLRIPMTSLLIMMQTAVWFFVFFAFVGTFSSDIESVVAFVNTISESLGQEGPAGFGETRIYDPWEPLGFENVVHVAHWFFGLILLAFALVGPQTIITSRISTAVEEIQILKNMKLTSFNSSLSRYAVLFGYMAINIVYLLIMMLVLLVMYYGLKDSFPSFVFEYRPSLVFQLIEGGYEVFDFAFGVFPVLSARYYSITVLSMMLSPLFIFGVGWVYSIGVGLHAWVTVLADWEVERHDALPDKIKMRVNDIGNQVEVRPVSLMFGKCQYVLVSQTVIDTLSDKELKAVLTHEVYHIKNRDLSVNIVASIFSVLFGGRNTLLAFYDYPDIEKRADRFAARKVGSKPLISALRKLENAGSTYDIPIGTPGFIPSNKLVAADGDYISASLIKTKIYSSIQAMAALYHFFYGRVLLDEAHMSVDDRIQRIIELKKAVI